MSRKAEKHLFNASVIIVIVVVLFLIIQNTEYPKV